MNPAIGEIDCPICAAAGKRTVAEVSRYAKGKKSLYYRCSECGTIQPNMVGGQENMRRLVRIFPAGPDQEAAAKVAAEEASRAAEAQTKAVIREERRKAFSLSGAMKTLFSEE